MQYSSRNNPIVGFILLVGFLVLAFYFIQGMFLLLKWITPVLLIATLIINRQVLINYGKWIYNLLRTNVLVGLLYTVLTIVGFPFVAGFLFLKAIGGNYIKKMERRVIQEKEGVLTDYEIVDSEVQETDYLELDQ